MCVQVRNVKTQDEAESPEELRRMLGVKDLVLASSAWSGHLERLIKEKGQLEVTHTNGGGVGLYWSATIGTQWPYCHGGTLEGALKTLVSEHLRLEREELQKRINAIDESAGL